VIVSRVVDRISIRSEIGRAFALLNVGWQALDRREAPACWPHTDFRGFAQSGSNPGHPTIVELQKKLTISILE
jgi:hypothetical protein